MAGAYVFFDNRERIKLEHFKDSRRVYLIMQYRGDDGKWGNGATISATPQMLETLADVVKEVTARSANGAPQRNKSARGLAGTQDADGCELDRDEDEEE